MLNKHEPNPPSATLVRGQSSYLQEQQIHLKSKPVLRVARLSTLPTTNGTFQFLLHEHVTFASFQNHKSPQSVTTMNCDIICISV